MFILLCAAVLLPGCGGDRNQSEEVRYTLTIAPGNYLFIYGHEFHGDVVCTLQPGDSLRIGGLPVLPRRLPPPRVFSDTELREAFGRVPFVQQRLRDGDTWTEASETYWQRVMEMDRSAERVYRREVGRSVSREFAAKAALDSLDRSLVDPAVKPEVTGGEITLSLEGLYGPHHIELGRAPSSAPTTKQPEAVAPEKTMKLLEGISGRLGGGPKGVWMVVMTHSDRILSGAEVARALNQLEAEARGDSASGPLSPYELQGILAVRRGAAK